ARGAAPFRFRLVSSFHLISFRFVSSRLVSSGRPSDPETRRNETKRVASGASYPEQTPEPGHNGPLERIHRTSRFSWKPAATLPISRNVRRCPRKGEVMRLRVESLESRDLPAIATVGGGVLTVLGTPDRDRIDVWLDSRTSQLVVTDANREIGRFASAAVSGIIISGGAGDDVIRIASDVT